MLFLDLDDTLVDHGSAVSAAIRAMHASWGVSDSIDSFTQHWRAIHQRHYPRYLKGELTYAELRRLRLREAVSGDLSDAEADEMFDSYFFAYESNWALFSDVVASLDSLADSRLGIITNGPSAEQRRKLDRLGIADRFEVVIISAECGCAKPSSQIFELACQSAGVSIAETSYVGDHPEIDVEGAIGAGMRGIWLDRSLGKSGEAAYPVVYSLLDVREVLAAA